MTVLSTGSTREVRLMSHMLFFNSYIIINEHFIWKILIKRHCIFARSNSTFKRFKVMCQFRSLFMRLDVMLHKFLIKNLYFAFCRHFLLENTFILIHNIDSCIEHHSEHHYKFKNWICPMWSIWRLISAIVHVRQVPSLDDGDFVHSAELSIFYVCKRWPNGGSACVCRENKNILKP